VKERSSKDMCTCMKNAMMKSIKIYKKEEEKDVFTPLFIAVLFIVANGYRQPKCTLLDKRISKDGVER
jgi:hypothetical protein